MDDLDRYIQDRLANDPEFKRCYDASQAEYDLEVARIRKRIAAKRIIGAFSFGRYASPNKSLADERSL